MTERPEPKMTEITFGHFLAPLLRTWANTIASRFNAHVYLCGSAIRKLEPRDIDIRVVLTRDQYEARYGNRGWYERHLDTGPEPSAGLLRYMEDVAKLAEWISQTHKLNVDFQIQHEDEVAFFGDKDKPRIQLDDLSQPADSRIARSPVIQRCVKEVIEARDAEIAAQRQEILNLNSIIGDYIQSTQIQSERIESLTAELSTQFNRHVDANAALQRQLSERDKQLSEMSRDVDAVLINVSQLLYGWHADGTAWSEWDEQVRQQVSALHRRTYARVKDRIDSLETQLSEANARASEATAAREQIIHTAVIERDLLRSQQEKMKAALTRCARYFTEGWSRCIFCAHMPPLDLDGKMQHDPDCWQIELRALLSDEGTDTR